LPDAGSYDDNVTDDRPVAYWAMSGVSTGLEPDLTGNGHGGIYTGIPAAATLPNGATAARFDGATQYLSVPSAAALSIPTTGELTWEAWIQPDVLDFPNSSDGGYVSYMGKCERYPPTCEWESRIADQASGQPSFISALAFNPSAGLGAAADWQPESGVIHAADWYHVVGEYETKVSHAYCDGPEPGSVNIWVNGIDWNQQFHGQTGCMSQQHVIPVANDSPLNIGTMAFDSWFKGAIGKVAIYDHLLPLNRIAAHYTAMTGHPPTGTCGASGCTLGP
jgi:hypothetical protein